MVQLTRLAVVGLVATCSLLAEQAHLIECRPPENAVKDAHGLYTGTYYVDGVAKGSCVTPNAKGSAVYVHYLEVSPSGNRKPCPPGKPQFGCVPVGSAGPYVPSQREYDDQLKAGPASGPPLGGLPSTGPAGVRAVPVSPPNAALLAKVRIAKGAGGVWKCTSGTQLCSGAEARAYTTADNSMNNGKHTLAIASDGTVTCTNAAGGTPCSDTEMQNIVTQLKAITKGGQQESY